jgi:hypothetical protein
MVCVAWYGFRLGGNAEEVLSSCSSNGGQNWPPPVNVSHTGGEDDYSINPALAFDSLDRLHVTWEEHNGSTISTPIVQIYHGLKWFDVFLPVVMRK